MATPRVWLSVFVPALALVLVAAAASAQYMYLDSNRDGVHTSADIVNSIGPTTFDVWLSTDHNRDGSMATCSTSTTQLTLNSYVICLHAVNGTIAWDSFVNRQPTMGVHFLTTSSATDYKDGYGGSTIFPPGLYLLATLTITVASGTPSIQIVPKIPNTLDQTSFGSHCEGQDFDNTLKLGSDWLDSDGLEFGSGGTPNRSPTLSQPLDMTVATGTPQSQQLTASDPDGQPLTFSKAMGPDYVSIATLDGGSSTATGEIYVAPRIGDTGNGSTSISVTDGFASDSKSLSTTVTSGPNHSPVLSIEPSVVATAGRISNYPLHGSDADGNSLQFSLASGPDYASVLTLRSAAGGAAGSLRLAPGLCQLGSAAATVAVTDGIASCSRTLSIDVLPAGPAPPSQPAFFRTGRYPNSVALGDLNNDGHPDIITTGPGAPGISVLLGVGDGTFGPVTVYPGPVGSTWPFSLAIADLNGDSRLDVAVTDDDGPGVAVLLGNGDGTLRPAVKYAGGSGPTGIVVADTAGRIWWFRTMDSTGYPFTLGVEMEHSFLPGPVQWAMTHPSASRSAISTSTEIPT